MERQEERHKREYDVGYFDRCKEYIRRVEEDRAKVRGGDGDSD